METLKPCQTVSPSIVITPMDAPCNEKLAQVSGLTINHTFGQKSKTKAYTKSFKCLLHSVWLFTYSDIKSILVPVSVFGLTNALASNALGQNTVSVYWNASTTLIAFLKTFIWVWILLIPYTINNQNQSDAIEEDCLNKPWRPLPSKRLSPEQAKNLMYFFYGLSFASSLLFGGFIQCLAAAALAVWYNSFGGADESVITRHLINGLQCIAFNSGALQVALGHSLRVNVSTTSWFGLLSLVIFTTLHAVDMPDQEGDATKCRKTLPLVIGDESARFVLALAMICWAVVCPRFWASTPVVRIGFLFVGLRVAWKTLTRRSVTDDKSTYRWWCIWLVFLYTMPFLGRA